MSYRKLNPDQIPTEAKCSNCLQILPSSDFYGHDSTRHGLSCYCRECTKLRARENKAKRQKITKVIPPTKICGFCGEEKESKDFYQCSGDLSGLQGWCKKCSELQRSDKRTELKVVDPKGFKANILCMGTRKRANHLGIPFDLTKEFILSILPDRCPVFNTPLKYDNTKMSDDSPSLDKFLPELGYVIGNVRIISNKANALKRNGTTEDIRKLLVWMEKTEKEVAEELSLTLDLAA